MIIVSIVPGRAFYAAGEESVVVASLEASADARLSVWRLGRVVVERTLRLAPGETRIVLGLLEAGGYLVELAVDGRAGRDKDGALARTALDVEGRAGECVRYAFLSGFEAADAAHEGDLLSLRALHATHVQFYDWMYRHHEFLPPSDDFEDAMGRKVSLEAVRAKIQACDRLGMRPIAYGAVYGAEEEYFRGRAGERLYRNDGSPALFIGKIGYMDIGEGSAWCETILSQYEAAVGQLGFAGVHMDQYGEPHRALASDGRVVDLGKVFGPLVARAKERLEAARPGSFVSFNCVNDWPLESVASSPQDAVYVEVWAPYDRYRHLREIARRARLLAPGKPVVLAAYLRAYATSCPEEEKEESALLALAVIHASGATQLAYGEEDGVLREGYYVNHAKYRSSFAPTLRAWMDFCVAYRELLVDGRLEDQGFRLWGGPNEGVSVESAESGSPLLVSLEYEAGKAGIALLERPGFRVLSLVNLMGQSDELWSEPKRAQRPTPPVRVRWLLPGRPKAVWTASPDESGGRGLELAWRLSPHPQGLAVEFELPETGRWRLAWIEVEE